MENLLANINWSTLGIVIGVMAVVSVIFAILIITVSKLCAVKEDEKAVAIQEKLAGANCGGCGYAGCADFAKALSQGKAELCLCGPTSKENKAEISKILGIESTDEEEKYAVVKCRGGNNCVDKFNYVGEQGCLAQANFFGGRKACDFGCLGGGTCSLACPNGGVMVKDGVAKTNKAICDACGLCAKSCPKKLIGFIPKSAKVMVACNSLCRGKDVMNACSVGCIGCGLCAKSCPNGAIEMVNNLPVIDYKKCSGCMVCLSKCPKHCIVET